ncbi:RHS repeat-associated core domain-containing protein [Actinoplanes sp. NPDC051861]|uniref:RHS repeat domain-containing protein n=1 Tax=Actinoplanes sp. NPDC051861 TaxID=3155170 RepID=UPI003419C2F1
MREKAAPDRSVPVGEVAVREPQPAGQSQTEQWAAPKVSWPAAGATEVPLGAEVPGQPVRIGAKTARTPTKVTSEVLSRERTQAAGVTGMIVALTRADGVAESAPVSVAIDYSSLRQAYGGDYTRRLGLVRLPACASRTPEKIDCQAATPVTATNDAASETLVADVGVAGESTVLAVTAAAASPDTGTFARSSLAASGSWVAGDPSGDFNWAYPVDVPPAPGDIEPEIELTYNSGSVDGRTNGENSQTSWLGEGWDYEPGYIERQYRGCRDDVTGATTAQYTNATDDLCYRDANATLSWNGKSTELVLDDATGRWRPADDDGSYVELVTGGSGTGLYNNEHWKLVTPDGTQFWFGKTRLPGWADTQRVTNSAWGVPVFANRSAEPCYKTGGFAGSWCSMAWRWNLDYVVDPHGNSMSFWYQKEANSTKLAGSNTVARYDRGGWLERIEYGTRTGSEVTATAPLKVEFGVGDRCLATCWSGTSPVAANWPDTPWDLQCNAAPCTNNPSPTFWNSKRLVKITTAADEFALTHAFPATAESTVSPSLFLGSITRTGKTGGSQALPSVAFWGTRYANRTDYNTASGVPAVNRYRVTRIVDETGGEVSIAYESSDCTTASQANPDSNPKRCFPQYYAPPNTAAGWSWWNKYRVRTVTEKDLVGGSPSVVETYDYATTGSNTTVLWHHNDDQKWSLPLARRSWSDWRGYSSVTVTTGATTGSRTKVQSRYFRGMHADRTDAGETARTASITDSHNTVWTDHNQLAGSLLEVVAYAADGTTPLYKRRLQPWTSQSGQRVESSAHVAPTTSRSYFANVQREEMFEYLPDSSTWREHEIEYEYETVHGQMTKETDRNLVSDTGDDICTTTSYARNTLGTFWLIDYPAEELLTDCGTQVLGGQRTYYDGASVLGAGPARGLDTRTDDLAENGVWVTSGTAIYDPLGRVLNEEDALGRTDWTSYTESGGRLTRITETNWAGHTEVSELDVRGNVITETDANQRVTTAAYDPLGRLVKMWQPGRPTSGTPNVEYVYGVQGSAGPSWVQTRELGPNGNQISGYDIYDGFHRPRQSQETAPDGKRAISDTRYDDRGLVSAETEFYNSDSGPAATLASFADTAVDTQDRYTYDGLERVTEDALWSRNVKQWSTTTAHAGDRTTVTPPAGGTRTTTYVDVTGEPVRLLQQDQATTYKYDRLGRLTTVTDPGNNVWTRAYDLRGRLTDALDPDNGSQKYEYDNADRLTTMTDGRGRKVWRKYDDIDRVVETREGGPTGALRASWTYDTLAKGELTSATRYQDGRAYTQTFTGYTDSYEPLGVTVGIPAGHSGLTGNYTIGYTYRADGSLATATYPAVAGLPVEQVDLTWTDQGDLTSMQGIDTYLAAATYAWHGGVKQRLLGSGGKRVRLDEAYEDSTFRLTKSQVSTERPGAANTFDEQLTELYKHDAAGNITAINEVRESAGGATVTQQCFQHDALRRLTEAWSTTAATCQSTPAQSGPDAYWQSFTYDAVGNRKTDTVHTAAGDTVRDYVTGPAGGRQPHSLTRRETRGGGPSTDFGYDDAGNLVSRTRGGGTDRFTWNLEGQLEEITTAEGGRHRNVYDAGGTRLLVSDASGTTLEMGHTEVRASATGQVTATRYYGDAIRTSDAGLIWIATDHHGTGQLAVDATGLTTVRRRTTPFGEARGTAVTWPDNKGFVGGAVDSTLGLVHLGAREYDPSTGRFLSVDPLIDYFDPSMLNGYAYANNSPVSFSDPDGMRIPVAGGGGGGGGGVFMPRGPGPIIRLPKLKPKSKVKIRKKAPKGKPSPKSSSSRSIADREKQIMRQNPARHSKAKPKKPTTTKHKKPTQKRGSGNKKSTGKKPAKTKKSNGGKRTGKPSGQKKPPKKPKKTPHTTKPKPPAAKPQGKPPTLPDYHGRAQKLQDLIDKANRDAQDLVGNLLDQLPDDDIGDFPGFAGSLADGATAEPGVAQPRGPPGVTHNSPAGDGIDPANATSLVVAIVWIIIRAARKRR